MVLKIEFKFSTSEFGLNEESRKRVGSKWGIKEGTGGPPIGEDVVKSKRGDAEVAEGCAERMSCGLRQIRGTDVSSVDRKVGTDLRAVRAKGRILNQESRKRTR